MLISRAPMYKRVKKRKKKNEKEIETEAKHTHRIDNA